MLKKNLIGISLTAILIAGCTSNSGNLNEDTTTTESSQTQTDESTQTQTESSGESGSDVLVESTVEQTESVSESSESNKTLTKKDVEDKYPSKTVLTWVYSDFVKISSAVNEAINEELDASGKDYVIWFKQLPTSDFTDNSIDAMSDVDLLTAAIGEHGTLQGTEQAVKNGWLLNLEDYLDSDAGSALKDAIPENMLKCCYVNGEIYGISTRLPSVSDYAYYVNKDIMEKCGITTEDLEGKTVTELGEIFEKLDESDCDYLVMNYSSESDNIDGYSVVVEAVGIQSMALAVNNQSDSGMVINLFDDEETAEWFRTIASYRANGYLPTYDEDGESKNRNFFIYTGYYSAFDATYSEQHILRLKSLYPSAGDIEVIPYMKTCLTTYFNSVSGVYSRTSNQEMALDALSATYLDSAISDLLLHGIEGTDYKLVDGKADEDSFGWIYSMYFGNTLISTPSVDEPDNKQEVYAQEISEMTVSPQLGVYFDFSDYADKVSDIQSIAEEYSGLFSGEYENVDDVLLELNEKLKEAGMDEVLAEANRQLSEARND